jgi:uncharacterized protein (TIGR02466 family)
MITWESIFPTPVMRSSIGRNFTDDELKHFRKLQAAPYENFSNLRSADTRVLDAPEMQSIRSVVAEHVNQYAWKVISAHPRHVFYITQSWVNFTESGQFHHRHMHTNSLISGVLYIQVKKEVDRICFYRNSPAQILVSDDQPNPYTVPSVCFIVDVGDLILFPSALIHDVERTSGAHTRISLAFNAFIRGELGSEERLNSLHI